MEYQKKEDKNLCVDCQTRLSNLLHKQSLPEQLITGLSRPKRTVTFTIPVQMDSGEIRIFNGYRVLYSDARGPGKGGIRFHPDVDLAEVKTLSFL
ncbi:MAG: Glu/Leu/Phe/Val dehydrogenase dimerization domain-containing protein, partial [Candidatus Paceibacterota bacterium]